MSNIKVVIGSNIKREAVLIDPRISAAEPVIMSADDMPASEGPNNVIATGENSRAILKKLYAR